LKAVLTFVTPLLAKTKRNGSRRCARDDVRSGLRRGACTERSVSTRDDVKNGSRRRSTPREDGEGCHCERM